MFTDPLSPLLHPGYRTAAAKPVYFHLFYLPVVGISELERAQRVTVGLEEDIPVHCNGVNGDRYPYGWHVQDGLLGTWTARISHSHCWTARVDSLFPHVQKNLAAICNLFLLDLRHVCRGAPIVAAKVSDWCPMRWQIGQLALHRFVGQRRNVAQKRNKPLPGSRRDGAAALR